MCQVGASLAGRVIGFRLVDGLVAVSCKKSVIEQQVSKQEVQVHSAEAAALGAAI